MLLLYCTNASWLHNKYEKFKMKQLQNNMFMLGEIATKCLARKFQSDVLFVPPNNPLHTPFSAIIYNLSSKPSFAAPAPDSASGIPAPSSARFPPISLEFCPAVDDELSVNFPYSPSDSAAAAYSLTY